MAADLLSDVTAALARARDAHTEAQGLVTVLQERIDDQSMEAAELRRLVTALLGYYRDQRRTVLLMATTTCYEHLDTQVAFEIANDPNLARAHAIAKEFAESIDQVANEERATP